MNKKIVIIAVISLVLLTGCGTRDNKMYYVCANSNGDVTATPKDGYEEAYNYLVPIKECDGFGMYYVKEGFHVRNFDNGGLYPEYHAYKSY